MRPVLIGVSLLFVGVTGNAQSQLSGSEPLGQQLAQVCLACHSLQAGEPHKLGPNLWNIVGRPVASAEGYAYSQAMQKLGGDWTAARLDHYLRDPAAMAPGNRMTFIGIKDDTQRAAVLAYLATLSDNPPQTTTTATPATAFDFGGLPPGAGQAEVFASCSACHSLMLVKQQGLSRERWTQTLEWMVEEQGMDELSPQRFEIILDYLSEHFGESAR